MPGAEKGTAWLQLRRTAPLTAAVPNIIYLQLQPADMAFDKAEKSRSQAGGWPTGRASVPSCQPAPNAVLQMPGRGHPSGKPSPHEAPAVMALPHGTRAGSSALRREYHSDKVERCTFKPN